MFYSDDFMGVFQIVVSPLFFLSFRQPVPNTYGNRRKLLSYFIKIDASTTCLPQAGVQHDKE
jgi:hypothetical protein